MNRAGGYRHPVTVQKLKASVDLATVDRGDASNWEAFVSRRAKINFKPGKEWLEASQSQAMISAVMWIRRDASTMGITPAMRVVANGLIYELVTASMDNEKQTDMILVCSEKK